MAVYADATDPAATGAAVSALSSFQTSHCATTCEGRWRP